MTLATEMPKMIDLMKAGGVKSADKKVGQALKAWYEAHKSWANSTGEKKHRLERVRDDKMVIFREIAQGYGYSPMTIMLAVFKKYDS